MKRVAFAHPERVILVVTALSEERRAVASFLTNVGARADKYDREFIYGDYHRKDDNKPWHIVLPSPTSAGNAKSAAETALSLSIDPAFIFLLGVAGGFPGKVNMYDVVVADRVYFVEPGKIDTEGSYIPRPDQHKATSILLSRAKTLQDLESWQGLLHPEIGNEPIEVWVEPIAAGEKLVACSSSEEFARIRAGAPRAVAVENEGFGVMQAAHEANVPALVIRGISDLLDNRPPEVSAGDDGRVGPDRDKLKAARHAAAFMLALIGRLSSKDMADTHEAEDDFVIVRMKWNDLRDLTKGRSIALELINDVPYRELFVRQGSVEVEFRTLKIISAFIYACSLEEKLFSAMIEKKPDAVDTFIDTSDPDVAKVFSAVRKLAATNEFTRLAGEAEMRDISERHPVLKPLSHRAIETSERLALALQNPSEADGEQGLTEDRRVTLEVPEWQMRMIREMSDLIDSPVGKVVRWMIEAAIVEEARRDIPVENFIPQSVETGPKITLILPEQTIRRIDNLRQQARLPSRSTIVRALIAIAFEFRVPSRIFRIFGESQERNPPSRRSRRLYRIRDLGTLLGDSELTLTELSKKANVSEKTLRGARDGRGMLELTAVRIIRVLAEELSLAEPIGNYLIPHDR